MMTNKKHDTATAVVAIQQALQEQRWETARRLALHTLSEAPGSHAIRMLLHEAYRKLGDYRAAQVGLQSAATDNTDEKLELMLLQAEDFQLMANAGHYRSSEEAKAGLSVDEYIDIYRQRSRDAIGSAEALVETPAQQTLLREAKERCGLAKKAVPPKGTPPEPPLPARGSAWIEGIVRFEDGSPAGDIRLVLGLETPMSEPDPATFTEARMGYAPCVAEPLTRETRTNQQGFYRFSQVPSGRHEFLAVCLDPLTDAIGTRFLAHNITVNNDQTVPLDLTVRDWKSAARKTIPERDIFTTLQKIDGVQCKQVHAEILHNPFCYDFPRQVVSFELPPNVPADSDRLRLLCSRAPEEHVPFQIDGTSLSFFATLPALSNRVFALFQAEQATPASSISEWVPLDIADDGKSAIIQTGCADFKIAWGEGTDALPPILAVRGEDGLWRGKGRWTLPSGLSVVYRKTDLIAHGSIVITARIAYSFSNGKTCSFEITAQHGEPLIQIHEKSVDIPEASFDFSLRELSGGRGFLHWTPENGGEHWQTLAAENRELARLQESVAWWIPPEGFGYAMTPDGVTQKDYIGVVTLRRGEWIDRLFERIAQGPGDDNRELDWPFPEMVGSTVSMITAHTSEAGNAWFCFGLFDGERRWGLLVSTLERNDGLWKEISAVQHKNSSPRLQDFKNWHLDEQDTRQRPHVLTKRSQLIHLRKKADTPTFAPLRQRVAEWKHIGNNYDRFDSRGLDAMLDADPVKLWTLKKEIATAAPIYCRMTLLGRDYSDIYSPVGGRVITPWAEVYDLIAPTGVFTPEEEQGTRAFLMLMGRMYMQTDLMNWRFNSRNANFEADRVDIVGGIGLVFQGNPDAQEMLDHAISLMQRSLEVYCTPGSGKWYENPACYYLHAASCRLNLAYHLWKNDIFDTTTIPRLKDFLSWGINIATAPYTNDNALLRDGYAPQKDTKTTLVRRIPPIGDHAHLGQWFSEYFALMGKAYRDKDPVFSENLFGIYQAGGSNGGHFSRHALFFTEMEETDLAPARLPPLASRRLEGFGSVFRRNTEQANEGYLLFKLGPGGYRYHRTEGSILLIHNGLPLIFDGGEAGETWRHTTLSFGDTHMPLAPGHIERFQTFDGVDFAQGVNPKALQPGEPVFLSDRCNHELVELAYARYREPSPANSRSVLWIGQDYIILHDQLQLTADRKTHWHLQAVADAHTGDWKGGYRFDGRFGTDLQVLFPGQVFEAERITQQPILEYNTVPEDTFSMRHLQLSATSPDKILAVLRPLPPGTNPIAARLCHTGGEKFAVAVEGTGINDLLWLDRNSTHYNVDGINFAGRYGCLLRRPGITRWILLDGELLEAEGVCIRAAGPAVSLTREGNTISIQSSGHGRIEIEGLKERITLNV